MTNESRTLTIFAPAKLNLTLHVTGRREEDGYHTLDSLVAFTDIGDTLTFRPAVDFALKIEGPFAGHFSARDRDSSPNSGNLVTRAVWRMAEAARRNPAVEVTLTKNLPLASGIGGGSADAAATVWGLLEWWRISRQAPFLPALLTGLGADVPVCFECAARRMRGIGDVLDPSVDLPELPVLIVNPRLPCSTAQVFSLFPGPYRDEIPLPEDLSRKETLVDFLTQAENQLESTACDIVPDVRIVLKALENSQTPLLCRMAGAGASCFALYDCPEDALASAEAIKKANPRWWVRTGWIGRPQRY